MKKLIIFTVTAFILFSSAQNVYAADNSALNTSKNASTSVTQDGLTMSPIITQISMDKNTSLQEKISIFNNNSNPVPIIIEFSNFISKDPFGDPQFQDFTPGLLSNTNIKAKSATNVTLLPKKFTIIPITINTLSNTEPGDYFIGIFSQVQSDPNNNQGNTALINSSLGSLFILSIKGNVKESGYIKSFSAIPSFNISTPITLETDFWDTGNTHLIPQGMINIYDIFNNKVASISLNDKEAAVLPVGVNDRIFKNYWSPSGLSFGYYTAKMYLTYGSKTITTVASDSSFWYLPVWDIILFVIIAVLLLLLLIINKLLKTKKK